jgi:hypothetical protein
MQYYEGLTDKPPKPGGLRKITRTSIRKANDIGNSTQIYADVVCSVFSTAAPIKHIIWRRINLIV